MFLRALFFIALLATITFTFIELGLAATRALAHYRSSAMLRIGTHRAVDAIQASLANQLAAGADPRLGPLTIPTSVPAACASAKNPCDYTTDATIVATSTIASTAATPDNCATVATNCGQNLQDNPYVYEGRVSARVTVNVRNASDGALLASRVEQMTFRTMRADPYVALTGILDRSSGDSNGAAEGDSAGKLSAGSDDSRITTIYHNDTSGQETRADSWSNRGWNNGNATSGAWSP